MDEEFKTQAAAVFDTAQHQRYRTFHETLGRQDALREAEKEMADLLPPAAQRKLRAMQEQARADRQKAYAELLAAGTATDEQVRSAFGLAYEAQQRATTLLQAA